tara:strand:- start:436 stop:1452 length:1017 start_codon:yes stop_codon:yes gene_type:complete
MLNFLVFKDVILRDKEHLTDYLKNYRNNNLKIGTISGSFDCLHDGHMLSLDFAKKRVDHLFVLLNSDESVAIYKGKYRPIQKIKQRLENLERIYPELHYFVFNELVPNKILELVQPDIHFISQDWSANPVEKHIILKHNGEIITHPHLDGVSTTKNLQSKNFILKSNKAIFFDRDGTINNDTGYLSKVKDIEINKENLAGIAELSKLNFLNIIVTNQSGISKGFFDIETLSTINQKIIEIIQDNNGRIDKVYFDISDSDNPSKFRKPNNGMIIKACKEFDISLRDSWMIGDKDSDIELGKMCNMKTIYIKNNKYSYSSEIKPDFKVNNLLEASKIIKS